MIIPDTAEVATRTALDARSARIFRTVLKLSPGLYDFGLRPLPPEIGGGDG